jgi:hypothetical protein
MFFLITRNRIGAARQTVEHCEATGMTAPAVAVNDGGDELVLIEPDNWSTWNLEPHRELAQTMNHCFDTSPDRPYYGFLTDGCRPVTQGWDQTLIEAAGDWGIAWGDDGWKHGHRVAGGVVFGGKLLRAIGYWVPRTLIHWFVDDYWELLVKELGVRCYRPGVKFEYHHHLLGNAPEDENTARVFNGVAYPASDQNAFEEWKRHRAGDVIDRVRREMLK